MMILTAQNATPENKAKFLQEYRNWRDSAKQMVRTVMTMAPTDWETDPPAVQYGKMLKAEREKEMQALIRRQPHLKSLITFVMNNGLMYQKLSDYQHRIKAVGTDRFVDWWDGKNKTMSDNGRWGKQGKNQAFLLQAVTRLAGGMN